VDTAFVTTHSSLPSCSGQVDGEGTGSLQRVNGGLTSALIIHYDGAATGSGGSLMVNSHLVGVSAGPHGIDTIASNYRSRQLSRS
jgi:hypothetical protein